MRFSSITIYVATAAVLIAWWGVAFRTDPPAVRPPPPPSENSLTATLEVAPLLSSLERRELQNALSGNFILMADLIHQWDIDALYLQALGLKEIKRLPSDDFLKSQLLGRQLKDRQPKKSRGRYLPQTYAAASFLLAIADTNEIIALPKGFREQDTLYSSELKNLIPLDIDRHHSEKLFMAKPEIAFVANYSHPSTVEALRNQGIRLFTVQSLNSYEDICQALTGIGEAVNRRNEATLLRLFMEAAMAAIDNRLSFEKSHRQLPKALYVAYYSTFLLPTKKHLTGQLLTRMGMMEQMEHFETYISQPQWSIPIDQEKIVNFKPDFLIISSDNEEGLRRRIESDPAFAGLKNTCSRIIFVDESIVNSPTQSIVLAYYDLVQAITQQ